MKANLEKAKQIFKAGTYTCVLCKNDSIYKSKDGGIKPLIKFIENGQNLEGFCAADKIVGKAAALLYVLLKVKAVYAPIMSTAAVNTFKNNGISFFYDDLVKEIYNRTNTGLCPMEQTVQDINDPSLALFALKQKISSMAKK